MKNGFNHYEPADLPEAGASAERISSVERRLSFGRINYMIGEMP